MSYGNCCVTSDIPECADVIADHGITFPKGSETALADILTDLDSNFERVAEYKAAAADYICNKYNRDDVVDKTLALYYGDK